MVGFVVYGCEAVFERMSHCMSGTESSPVATSESNLFFSGQTTENTHERENILTLKVTTCRFRHFRWKIGHVFNFSTVAWHFPVVK